MLKHNNDPSSNSVRISILHGYVVLHPLPCVVFSLHRGKWVVRCLSLLGTHLFMCVATFCTTLEMSPFGQKIKKVLFLLEIHM